ncbi:transmembrane protein 43 homolog [Bemisia tabaci]|uniref:transmembrane protein 43 homolog n=1 Tax=Bemisia tabaci TaxID=7038 RepID=UPI003B2831AF
MANPCLRACSRPIFCQKSGRKVSHKKYQLTTIFSGFFFIVGVVLLFECEWEAGDVNTKADQLLKSIVSLPSPRVYPENEGLLVHVTGIVDVDEPLTEVEYSVSVPAVKLKRRVQMYQWVEEKDSISRVNELSLSREYFTEWRDKIVNSTKFIEPYGHENPKSIPLNTTIYVSDIVSLGEFTLSSELKDMFSNWVQITGDQRPERNDVKLHAGLYYHSMDVWEPEVGDIRLQFSYAGLAGDLVTFIAQQHKNELRPFWNESVTQRDLSLLAYGRKSVEEMFNILHREQTWQTRIKRSLCCVLLYCGMTGISQIIKMIVCPNRKIEYVSPYSIIMLILGSAWLYYYPVLSSILIAGAVFLVVPFFPFSRSQTVDPDNAAQYQYL